MIDTSCQHDRNGNLDESMPFTAPASKRSPPLRIEKGAYLPDKRLWVSQVHVAVNKFDVVASISIQFVSQRDKWLSTTTRQRLKQPRLQLVPVFLTCLPPSTSEEPIQLRRPRWLEQWCHSSWHGPGPFGRFKVKQWMEKSLWVWGGKKWSMDCRMLSFLGSDVSKTLASLEGFLGIGWPLRLQNEQSWRSVL